MGLQTSLKISLIVSCLYINPAYADIDSEGPKARPVVFQSVTLKKSLDDVAHAVDDIKKGRFSIGISSTTNNVDAVEKMIAYVGSASLYQYLNQEAAKGNDSVSEINTVGKLQKQYLQYSDDGDFEQLTPQEQSARLQEFAKDFAGVDIPTGMILSEITVDNIINDPNHWKKYARDVADDLSFGEKIRVASQFGREFVNDYNSDRAGEGNGAEGVVDIETLLKNLKTDEMGGVCRDIALANGQILNELGVPSDNIYFYSFATATGRHSVIAVEDPNDKSAVVKINYDYVQESEDLGGPAALELDGTNANVGLSNTVYNLEGEPVGRVPTEIGRILREVTGGTPSMPLETPTYSINKVTIVAEWGRGTVFSGKTAAFGDEFLGVAFDKTIRKAETGETYEIGVAFLDRKGDGRELVDIDQQTLYFRLKYMIERSLYLGPVRITGFLGGEAEVGLMNTTLKSKSSDTEKSGFNIDPVVSGFGGVRGEMEANDGRTLYYGSIAATSYLDFNNFAAGGSDGYTLATDNIQVVGGVRQEVASHFAVTGEAMFTYREVGNTITLTTGLEDTYTQSSAELLYQKPLSDDIPVFFDGSTEIIGFRGVRKMKGTALDPAFEKKLVVEYTNDLDLDTQGVGLSLEIPLGGMFNFFR